MDIGRLGVWERGAGDGLFDADSLAELAALGYRTLWLGGSPAPTLELPEQLLARSRGLVVATGIVNVWDGEPRLAADAYRRIASRHPDRLLLGIGAGHRALVGERYTRPYDRLVSYLDGLDTGGVPRSGRVLAALGPRVLELAARRTAGAHPYLVTPEHTATARRVLGGDALLAPEQKVVLERDPDTARRVARSALELYLRLPNYTNNLRRIGFTDDDVTSPGSDRLVDALVAWGDEDAIHARVAAHHQAGADHVALQVLGADRLATLRALAPALVGG